MQKTQTKHYNVANILCAMPNQPADDDGFTKVSASSRSNNVRSVHAEISVFSPVLPFALEHVPKVVEAVLTQDLGISLASDVKAQAGSQDPKSFHCTLVSVMVKVFSKDVAKARDVLNETAVVTRKHTLENHVDASRYALLKENLHASAYFDKAIQQHKITMIVCGKRREADKELEKCVQLLQMRVSRQHHREVAVGEAETSRPSAALCKDGPSAYDTILQETTTMQPEAAIRRLGVILETIEADTTLSILEIYSLVHNVDYHYILACLGMLEMTGVRCSLSTTFEDLVRIHRRPSDPWFTNRRPSVERGDVVTLTCVDGPLVGRKFETEIVLISQDDICVRDVVVMPETQTDRNTKRAPISTVEKEEGTGGRRGVTLKSVVEEKVMFDLLFDTKKFSIITEIRKKFAISELGKDSFRLLRDANDDVDWGEVEKVVERRKRSLGVDVGDHPPPAADGDDDMVEGGRGGRGRGAGRRERGGIAGGGRAPPVVSGLEEGLDADQRLLYSLLVRPVVGLRKVVVKGPAGVGKTETLCRAIRDIVLRDTEQKKILYIVPSKSAGDVACLRLLELFDCPSPSRRMILRMYPSGVHPLETEPTLLPYSNLKRGEGGSMKPFSQLTSTDEFVRLTLSKTSGGAESAAYISSFVAHHRVVITTVTQARYLHSVPYDIVIIDEVVQCHLLDALQGIAFGVGHPKRLLVLAGDPKQMGSSCFMDSVKPHLRKAALHYIQGSITVDLKSAHRYSSAMGRVINDVVYDGKLTIPSGGDGDKKAPFPKWPGHYVSDDQRSQPKPIRFIHVERTEAEQAAAQTTNMRELEIVVNVVESLCAAHADLKKSEIVVLAATTDQQKIIRERLQLSKFGDVLVTDEESFQGDERRVCVCSFVSNSSSPDPTVPFPDERRRATMITRGRDFLVIVCDVNALSQSPNGAPWRKLLRHSGTAVQSLTSGDAATAGRAVFDWTPLPVRALEVKEFRPQCDRKTMEDHYKPCSVVTVLNNLLDYFVGVVVGQRSDDDESRRWWIVRNAAVSRYDAYIDLDVPTSKHGAALTLKLFPGDIVALRLDPRTERWRDVEIGDAQYRFNDSSVLSQTVPVEPARASQTLLQLRQASQMFTVDDFAVVPKLIEIKRTLSHPIGHLACIVQRATYTAIPGANVLGTNHMFRPAQHTVPRLPELPIEQYAQGNWACLRFNHAGSPYYDVRSSTTGGRFAQPLPQQVHQWDQQLLFKCTENAASCNLVEGGGSANYGLWFNEQIVRVYFPACGHSMRLTGDEVDFTVIQGVHLTFGQPIVAVELTIDVSKPQTAPTARLVMVTPTTTLSPNLAEGLENEVNSAVAHYLWCHLPTHAVFVRFCYAFRDRTGWSIEGQSAMASSVSPPFKSQPIGLGTDDYRVYANAARFTRRPLDQLTVALLSLAALLDCTGGQLREPDASWLKRVPHIRAMIEGWGRCGFEEALPYTY